MDTEFEKMLAGELYDGWDADLVAKRHEAKRLMRELNAGSEDDLEKRRVIIKALLGSTGEKVYIEPPFYCDYGLNIHAKNDLYMNFGCTILDCAEVHFGESVMLGPNVQIYTATHPLDAEHRATGAEYAKPVKIGNRVWVGGGTIICPGVTIGDDVTIGAGSVVTKDVPSHVLAVGNPCKVIRKLK